MLFFLNTLTSSVTAPLIIGEATEVPDSVLHPPDFLDPRTCVQYVTYKSETILGLIFYFILLKILKLQYPV